MKRLIGAHLAILALTLLAIRPLLAEDPAVSTDPAAKAEVQQMLEEVERARAEAEVARREAERLAERAREMARVEVEQRQREAELAASDAEQRAEEQAARAEEQAARAAEMERVREELSRTHRELREASREVARAHRELGRAEQQRVVMHVNLGDRAVIGVVLGAETPNGIELMGVSPGGPAEQAGIQAGDVMTEIGGQDLRGSDEARGQLFEIMEGVEPGDELQVVVERDGKPLDFTVRAEVREPSSWQSIIRLPEMSTLEDPEKIREAEIIVEQIRDTEFNQEALQERMQDLQERLETQKFIFIGPDGQPGATGEVEFEFSPDKFSSVADEAFAGADIWFGLPHARGLEFATVNPELGAYFKTDRGVLVLEAEDDNSYGLRAGDVILAVDGEAVDTPAELLRALRGAKPGTDVVLEIKRERRSKTLNVTMPENRLGLR